MGVKEFLKELSKKLLDSDVSNSLFDSLKEKSIGYLKSGTSKEIIVLIMNRFVPRKARKIIQTFLSIKVVLSNYLFSLANKFNDDSIKEECFILVMANVKKIAIDIEDICSEVIKEIKDASVGEKIDSKMIEIASDNSPFSDEELEDI